MTAFEPEPDEDPLGPIKGPTSAGKYHLFASLGRGGMAEVFLGVARGPMGFNKLVVIKRLRSALAEEPSFRLMFADEARLAARLNHPNVVQTYEVGEQDESYFIAMEYLEGQSLQKISEKLEATNDRFDQRTCARIVSDALAGLHHAHELRDYDGTPLEIIHRDISPHNVFVTYEGQVKLVDFGIAKAVMSSTQTEVGVLKGKVAYMSPEQAMGENIDCRADIFSMGIVLWELLTRERLMTGGSRNEGDTATLLRLLNEPIPRVSSVLEGIDRQLDDIVAKALEKDPEKRFASAQAMREALEVWIAASGQAVRQEDIGQRVGTMFKDLREGVKRKIQTHMELIESAGEAEDLDALVPKSQPSRGSGVMSFGRTDPSVSGHPRKKARAAGFRVALMATVLLVAALAVAKFASRTKEANKENDTRALATATASATTTPIASAVPTTTNETPATSSTASASAARPVASTAPRVASTLHPPRSAPTSGSGAGNTSKSGAATATASTTEAAPPGFLTLDTVPWTLVTADGRSLESTPVIGVPLAPGAHVISLDNPDEGIHTKITVTIKSGEQTRIRRVLKN